MPQKHVSVPKKKTAPSKKRVGQISHENFMIQMMEQGMGMPPGGVLGNYTESPPENDPNHPTTWS